jgi:preprotein translocase subunit SecB
VRVGLAQNPEEPHQYQIRLIVSDNAEANADRPYRLDFAAVGFFEIDQDFEHNDIERLVRINGSSVLYSALRELVLIITSRSAWGPITLPTINFRLTELGVAEGE